MITGTKYVALTILTHSLVSGIYEKEEYELKSDIKDFDIKKKRLDDSLKILTQSLEEQNATLEYLQGKADTIFKHQLQYYYLLASNNLDRFIVGNEEIINKLIGLSISSYIIEEKGMGSAIGSTPSELISIYEDVAIAGDEKIKYIIKRCLNIGSMIVESIDKASYNTYNRKMKRNLNNSTNKSNKKKNKRKK